MKIGILSFPNSTSFGATLQMYALYSTVQELGIDVEIINYHNAYMKAEKHMSASKMAHARRIIRKIAHHRQAYRFRKFEKGMSLYPRKPFQDKALLLDVGKRYDRVICGSDQVWNPDITDYDMSYFLDFCGEERARISYAPSFGVKSLPESMQNGVQNELKMFDHLSVREKEGQQIIRELIGKEVPLVLDPTFLLSAGKWTQLEKYHSAADEPYILYYVVRSSKTLMRFCLDLAEKMNVRIVIVGGNLLRQIRNKNPKICYAYDIGPQEWLYLVHHAACVVTNSFHGTAFSINYQKDFYVEFSSLTNSRLEHIIGIAGLHSRVVKSGCAPEAERIEYTPVNSVFSVLRVQSMEFLREAVISD
ncbi:MAG: polysaccharide pyruvyl transferase family protein [Clostridia bacterium]|nr:polysaccharide pyruvyl transferase family protein [Clostridia bacterium]